MLLYYLFQLFFILNMQPIDNPLIPSFGNRFKELGISPNDMELRGISLKSRGALSPISPLVLSELLGCKFVNGF